MAINSTQAIRYIAQDERFLLELLAQINNQKIKHREGIEEILERYIVSEITDENGYLKPNALTDEEITRMQQELTATYAPGVLDEAFAEVVGLVDDRLVTIDDLMLTLELEDGILGDAVFEMETVQTEVEKIATGFARGAYGTDEYTGSVERIQNSINRYRFDKSKSEFTLRSELMDTLRTDANVGMNHANSVAQSSMATIDRALRRAQALEAGIEHGLYSGPFDAVIRPFCNDWLGQVQTWAFWDALVNNMPPGLMDTPVSKYGGGINCRHRIVAWLLEWSNGNTDLRERFARAFRKEIMASSMDLAEYLRTENLHTDGLKFFADV